jgi:hypothetical protein
MWHRDPRDLGLPESVDLYRFLAEHSEWSNVDINIDIDIGIDWRVGRCKIQGARVLRTSIENLQKHLHSSRWRWRLFLLKNLLLEAGSASLEEPLKD